MGKIVLVTGGARSGKSLFAENYAKKFGKNVSYIATAEIYDDEMKERVRLHRERRPAEWETFEASKNADVVIKKAAENSDMILFDCLTIYLSNLILASEKDIDETVLNDELTLLVNAAKKASATVVFVTNEVGAGIVPENKLARIYRDVAGRMNQMFSKNADEVYFVVSGFPMDLKKLMVKL